MTRLTAKRVEELCKQFGDLYINSQPNIYPQVLLDITALCEVALQSLSLESVRSDDEIAEFQQQVYSLCEKFYPEVDGGGTDSGDWRDFTLSEIRQTLNHLAESVRSEAQ